MRPNLNHSAHLAVVCFFALALPAVAADVSIKPGDQTVRIDVRTAEQLKTVLAMDLDIHSHRIGIGPLDVHVSMAERRALRTAGLGFQVLDPDVMATHQAWLDGLGQRGGGAFKDYMPFADIVAFINNLAVLRPDLCQIINIGTSIEGRSIWVLHITGAGAGPKPGVFYHGLQHVREWITAPVVLYFADYLVNNYDSDPCVADLVDRTDFYLAPCVNPDGYVYTWPPDDVRFWRKNRRDNGGSFGVDLNRNWAYGWGGGGSSSNPSSEIYRGTAPFSEPETQALSNFITAHPNIRAYMDYHSYSQLILWPWGTMCTEPPEPHASTYWMLGNQQQSLIAAVHGQSYQPGPACLLLYQASGISVDWVYGSQNRFAFTIELRDTGVYGFQLPPTQIIPTCEENLPVLLYLADWASAPLTFDLPQGLPTYVGAGSGATITVAILPGQENLVPGSGLLHYRFDPADPFSTAPLTPLGGDNYQAVLPPGPCDATVEYYFSAQGDGGGTATTPCGAPASTYSALVTEVTTIFSDDFETDTGWTVSGDATDGQWQRGIPVNGNRGDPPSDQDGSGRCYVTDNVAGNSDVDNGTTILTSPVIDMTGGAIVSYAYWLNDIPTGPLGPEDSLKVEMATDPAGTNWTLLRTYGTAAANWRADTIDVGTEIPATPTMRIRFSASDLTPGDVVEAGLDAFGVFSFGCPCATVPGDMNGDGWIRGDDIAGFVAAMTTSPFYAPCADMTAPYGAPLDAADLSEFVTQLLAP